MKLVVSLVQRENLNWKNVQLDGNFMDTYHHQNFSLLIKGMKCNRTKSKYFNFRFSLVTVPQAVNRVLQSIVAMNPTLKTMGTNKKRKGEKSQEKFDMQKKKVEHSTIISTLSQRFRNPGLEAEYHKETDHWFIPSLAISIFFLVVYGIYHMLVMPRLITSLALIVGALTVMFFILLMLYIDYFHVGFV